MASQEHLLIACIKDEVKPFHLKEIQSRHPTLQVTLIPEYTPVPIDVWRTITLLLTSRVFPASASAIPNLKWLHLFSAGYDQLPSNDILPARVRVTTSSGIHASQISEWIFAYMLQHTHNLSTVHQLRRNREWPDRSRRSELFSHTSDLRGKTLGLVGYGAIARQTAALGKAFGMRCLAYTSSAKADPASKKSKPVFRLSGIPGDPDGVIPEQFYHGKEGFQEILRHSDFIVLSLPLSPDTRGLLSSEEFMLMKSTSYVINISRGLVIDQAALIEALQTHQIAGAALDVTTPEPLPSDSELWGLDNLFLSPHASGFVEDYFSRVVEVWEQNWKPIIDGEEHQVVNEVQRKR
ncbi:hypothetical protein MMC08_003925 [Hypocenomyce scalaris]|nr:hypothetical protein [Hypocenomyce scalaris]